MARNHEEIHGPDASYCIENADINEDFRLKREVKKSQSWMMPSEELRKWIKKTTDKIETDWIKNWVAEKMETNKKEM